MENENRHEKLLELGFKLDNSWNCGIYNHENGTWIADFALDQYSNNEWECFLTEFEQANHPASSSPY